MGRTPDEPRTSLSPRPADDVGAACPSQDGVPSEHDHGAAREDRARLDLAMRMANIFAWEIDPETRDISFTPHAESVLGFALGSSIAELMEYVHADDCDHLAACLERALESGGTLEAEYRVVHPDVGGIVWVQAQGTMLDDISSNGPRLIGVAQNITELKHRELNAAFLLQLGDVIRPLTDPGAIEREATRLLGQYLGASRVVYGEIRPDGTATLGPQYTDNVNVPALPDRVQVDAFGPALLSFLNSNFSRTVVVTDVMDDPDMSPARRAAFEAVLLRAHVDVPLVKAGRLVGALAIHQSVPRKWTEAEVTLIEETAQRIWAAVEHVRAEVALRASEERYRTLFEAMDQGFCVIEVIFDDKGAAVDYRFLEVNPAFEQQTGLREATGKRARDLVPDLEDHWFETYGRVAATGESVRFVNGANAMAGRWFSVNAFRIGDPNSRTVAILFTDITEARRVDAAMRESEERLRHVIEIETVGVVFFKADGAITFANDAFLHLSGYSRDDVETGKVRWDTMTPPEWMPQSLRAIDEFLILGRTTPYEKEYVRKNGSRWWALLAAARLDADEGIEFIIDITKTKRAELERERLAAIVEFSLDAVIGVDLDGMITDWNPAAEELYGYGAAEVVGRDIGMLIPPERVDERLGVMERLSRGEEILPYETVRLRKDGSQVDVEIRPSPVRDAAERLVGVAIIARDATTRKRLERAQADFLAMASHDLRSPITVLHGRAQLMRRREAYDEKSIDVMLEQIRRIDRLVADLQEVVKLESGGIELSRSSVELGDLARDAVERARVQAKGHTIRLVRPEAPVHGEWDGDRLGQVLDNLVGNAVKYSSDGGEIVVRVAIAGGEARLTVKDQGDGIPAETLPHLFERFYRADNAGVVSGLGLGLYISRMLVEAHSGRIWAESEPGLGSTFTIALPLEL